MRFKNILPVGLGFVGPGETVELETDKSGLPLNKEARKRVADGGLIEVKSTPRAEIKKEHK